MDTRRKAWQPPPRPEWVKKINEEARSFDLDALLPLDEQSLLRDACRVTGLSDFGSDDWREPFSVLCRSMREEAQLNFIGRALTRNEILQFLSARLRVEDAYQKHPQIEDERIESPILIIGQGRSGTSFLQTLLGQDPRNRIVHTWEAMYPAPPVRDAQEIEERIARAEGILGFMNRVAPELLRVHEFTARAPAESITLMALAFVGDWIPGTMGQVPTFQAFYGSRIEAGVRYERRVLKLLQWRNPKRQWILKSPSAISYLPETFKVYPDLKLVWAHRDPVKAQSSLVGLQGVLNWLRSDQPFRPGAHEVFFRPDLMSAALTAPIDLLESAAIPQDRLANVQYAQLVQKPLDCVEHLYRDLGMTLPAESRDALLRYLNENPRDSRPPHIYKTGDRAQIEQERAAYRRYQEYFGVPNEIL